MPTRLVSLGMRQTFLGSYIGTVPCDTSFCKRMKFRGCNTQIRSPLGILSLFGDGQRESGFVNRSQPFNPSQYFSTVQVLFSESFSTSLTPPPLRAVSCGGSSHSGNKNLASCRKSKHKPIRGFTRLTRHPHARNPAVTAPIFLYATIRGVPS